ncbi:MAG TPA: hypothetical protein VNI01_16115 [Elusimicrobiota bacterium]|jgi:hypothetical protein|nr:hypothetical protein [Elusimicrobiota bacterium]
MRAALLAACIAFAVSARAAEAPDAAGYSARAQDKLADGTELSFELTGDEKGAFTGLTVSLKPASADDVATTVILILAPASGGGGSVQLALTPPAQPGKASTWDLGAALSAAVRAGKLDGKLERGSDVLLQLLRPGKKSKGKSVAPPLSATWNGGPIAPSEKDDIN